MGDTSGERVYSFQANNTVETNAWILALRDVRACLLLPIFYVAAALHAPSAPLKLLAPDLDRLLACLPALLTLSAWLPWLRTQESNSSENRKRAKDPEHEQFIAAARDWMTEVLRKHNAPKLKDIDAMLEEWAYASNT